MCRPGWQDRPANRQGRKFDRGRQRSGADGQVYYATFSLEPEEGEEVIRTILHFNLAKIIPFTPDELGIFARSLAAEGWARIMPDCLTESGLDSAAAALGNDGFFIARLAPLTA